MAAGVLVAAELATGTFYLLMLALGAAAAALAAHLGLAFGGQLLAAAVVGGGAVAAWHCKRSRQPAALPAEPTATSTSTSARRVHVTAWGAEGNARVQLPRRELGGAFMPAAARRSRAAMSSAPSRQLAAGRARRPASTDSYRFAKESSMEVVYIVIAGHRRDLHLPARSRSCRSSTPGWSSASASTTAR